MAASPTASVSARIERIGIGYTYEDASCAALIADRFSDLLRGVNAFASDDLEGLRLLRDRAPAPTDITAGEYGYDAFYFRRMLEAQSVDVLQADATRCPLGSMQPDSGRPGHGNSLKKQDAERFAI